MKIACQSCQAKYTIADEKVLGRVVKIRCKKCGSTIVINGNEAADSALSPPDDATAVAGGSPGGAYDYSAPQGEEWTVNVAEGDQRTMRLPEIVAEFKAGVVNDETYCWKDGMNDWLPLREIPALASACSAPAPSAPSRFSSQAPTAVTNQAPVNYGGGGFANSPPAANGSAGVFAQQSAAAAPAARRTGGRGSPGADLFGNVADAGGENDVMTSAPQGTPEAHDNGEAKLTGQRNENSVLFSLSALTSTGPKENGSPTGAPQADGSGLIDIRALAGSMSAGTKEKTSHVDDIMNLGGGGAFTAALAAPVLAAPPMEADMAGGSSQKSNKGIMIALSGVAIALLLLVVVLLVRKPEQPTAAAEPSPTTSAATGTAATVATADPSAAAARPADSVAAPTTAAAPDTSAKAPPVAVARNNTPRPPSPGNGGGNSLAAPPPPPPPPATHQDSFEKAISDSVGKPPPAAAGGGGDTSGGGSAPFDRGAAAAALGAVNVQACKKGDGPTGQGHVSITFMPNGSVGKVEADQPPYQGTGVGGCVAAKFRSARVPAFGGSAQKVGKSFSIN